MTPPPQPPYREPPPPRRERRSPQSPHNPQSPQGAQGAKGPQDPKDLERLYVITGGTDGGERAPLDLVTLIVARTEPKPTAPPEQAAVLRMCRTPLSTAEISAYLNLPFSVVTVLLGELLAAEQVQARAPVIRGAVADRSLLEAVMHGLQKL
ncbi:MULTISPECIES: DUF742 domain-containing protein [unclassified Streptomyces]|uniref:DUF742 domain-containing protein n=1 Tax=unclassified Streptomyces TaxID=2593676 RepID=UPI000DBA79D7|nr:MULTISPECIES: DUF742 domain-containing protein [unclassified Streptomyces]MYT69480.1 DUF742 domain-containing protein [Streptomyces sp. SID8367]RAJ79866.1 uncharacterized protein DUF742 [Streptomyces sp. PsTaAH-137]